MALNDLLAVSTGMADGEAMPAAEAPKTGADAVNPVGDERAPITIGGITVLPRSAQHRRLLAWSDPQLSPNIAEQILKEENGESRLNTIGEKVRREYEIDVRSRSDWLSKAKEALDLAMQVAKPRQGPWPNSSNIVYPLVAMAAQQFAARAYPAIINAPDVVKGVIVGKDEGQPAIDPNTGQQAKGPGGEPIWEQDPRTGVAQEPGIKRKRADRIGEHMSWQLLEEQPEWEEETDKLLHILPIAGCAFRKTYFDPGEGRNVSCLVFAQNLVVNYWAKSLDTAPRITEEIKLYPVEIEEKVRAGLFLKHEYGLPPDANGDDDAPHEFLEQHRRLDLDGDGYAEPYIVTVHKATSKVARILARFDADSVKFSSRRPDRIAKIDPVQFYTKYDFLPNPDGGVYGVGFGQLLGSINESINTSLNMLFDAGHLQNAGGGFIGKGLSMHGGEVRFHPGKYHFVNSPGRAIREAIVPLEHGGPSEVLFKLLGFMIEVGDKLASNTEVLSGQQTGANVPASTTLALIEQGLKVFTAIYKRVHRSLKSEFDKLYRLNRLFLEETSQYRWGEEWRTITLDDYRKGSSVEPISDPQMVSDMQKLVRAEFLKGFLNDPLFDGMEIRRRILKAARIEDIDALLKPNPAPDPAAMLKGEEIKIKHMVGKAQALHYMASAIERMAEADKKVAETFGTWVQTQMNALQQQYEALDGDDGSGPGGDAAPAGGQRSLGAGLSALVAPPGDAGRPPVPA